MQYGKRPEERTVEELLDGGIIVIDKPSGPTSHQVAAWISALLNRKCAHGGTLDPGVTGVLPVGTGISVRVMDALHYLDKEYVCLMAFHSDISRADVERLFSEFTGEVFQVPPVRSAVKRERRIRRIFSLKLIEMDGRRCLFSARCQAGTYIRTLCRDLGEAACTGGQMEELRRVRSGPFDDQDAVTLQQLEDALFYYKEGDETELRRMLRPYESLLLSFPRIVLKDSAVDSICRGADLTVRGIASISGKIVRNEVVSLFTQKQEGVALARALMTSENMQNVATGIACDTLRVFMKPGTYPRFSNQ
ncbi:MAG: RNA-guided pseudouridylation complex pseudouridine synthase subunit Cbf5 [Methanomassiliicoccales archaeon]